jgi:hypothetical protein
VINCQHKGRSRLLHREVAPAATPLFAAVYGAADAPPACPPPWFAKPIVGRLSQGARRVDDTAAFRELTDPSGYSTAWALIAELAGVPRAAANGFLVEELARGAEVTLEGYVYGGRVTVVGITDSIMYAGTNSFERFEYPSTFGEERQEELSDVARRIVAALGFDGGFFNMEFVVPVWRPPPRRGARRARFRPRGRSPRAGGGRRSQAGALRPAARRPRRARRGVAPRRAFRRGGKRARPRRHGCSRCGRGRRHGRAGRC